MSDVYFTVQGKTHIAQVTDYKSKHDIRFHMNPIRIEGRWLDY